MTGLASATSRMLSIGTAEDGRPLLLQEAGQIFELPAFGQGDCLSGERQRHERTRGRVLGRPVYFMGPWASNQSFAPVTV